LRALLCWQHLLDHNIVPPIIAKVIDMGELSTGLGRNLIEPRPLSRSHFIVTKIWIGLPKVRSVSVELIEMRIRPAHCQLEDAVQLPQIHVAGHTKPSPNGRLGTLKRDLQLVDRSLPC